MTVDYSGVAILIGAVAAAIGSIATTVLQWRASKKIDANKQEAMAARAEQTNTIIQSAVTPALNASPPAAAPATPVLTKEDADLAAIALTKKGEAG